MAADSLNILLLEDNLIFAKALSLSLDSKGHHTHHCQDLDALDAYLSAAKANNTELHLALLDLKLENATSMNHIHQIRQHFPHSKIYMITAYASIATTVDAIKEGADDYLPKPINTRDILSAYYGKPLTDAQTNVIEKTLSPKRVEWEHIQRVLKENNGNISQTAKQLSMHRRTLQRKLQKNLSFNNQCY